MPAIVFAGGKSSRMGKDKALLPFEKYKSLSEFQYKKLQTLFKKVYLSAKESKFDFDAPIILDIHHENSPLIALISIFETLNVKEIFILSVDAPFVKKEIIESLLHQAVGADAVVAKSPQGVEPLCGIYRKSILPLAKKHLSMGNHKLNHLLATADTQFISFEEDAPFMNLNHPYEYENALKLISF